MSEYLISSSINGEEPRLNNESQGKSTTTNLLKVSNYAL